jgi:CCR4-NOT transcription complex subunit 1
VFQWVADAISLHGPDFVAAILNFVRVKIASELERQEVDGEPQTVALSLPTIALYLRALARANLTGDEAANNADVRILCFQLHPRLMNLIPQSPDEDSSISPINFSEDVEAEVDDIYHKMYNEGDSIPVETVVSYLSTWRYSDDSRRQEVYACMLYTLFDEYKFFHTYPPRELALTGKLFGALILRRLVEGPTLTVAIRFVIDALKSSPESATSNFNFGIIALQAFQTRLGEFPEVCNAILTIPHLHESHPHLIEFVRTTLADKDAELNGGRDGGNEGMQEPTFNALRLNSFDLSGEPLEEPDEDTSDKILFIVNNLAPSNFESKTQEMSDAFQLQHSRWFANYFIGTRVSVEPNNHSLYMQFIEALGRASLEKHILYETFAKIFTLLNSDKTVSQAPDRATLKNLGSWLGRLTLARDKPIKHKNLSLKDLLIEGYDAKRLIVAIPFVCKVLEQCSRSKVFHPPNPWLMAVIRLLVELYQNAELKLNLKFEIEVLCKSLSIDLAQIEPTTIIRDRPVEEPVVAPVPTLSQDLERLSMGQSYGGVGTESTQRMTTMQLYQSEAAAAAAQAALNRKVDELIDELPHYLVFLPDAIPFNTNTTLKRIFHVAVTRAIREIVVPVVERSVTIAGIASRDLITKDFATEGSEDKMRKAAHLMVQNLAGNLATVTCKEPLRTSITTNVQALLRQNGFSDVRSPLLLNLPRCWLVADISPFPSCLPDDHLVRVCPRRRRQQPRPGLLRHQESRPGQGHLRHGRDSQRCLCSSSPTPRGLFTLSSLLLSELSSCLLTSSSPSFTAILAAVLGRNASVYQYEHASGSASDSAQRTSASAARGLRGVWQAEAHSERRSCRPHLFVHSSYQFSVSRRQCTDVSFLSIAYSRRWSTSKRTRRASCPSCVWIVPNRLAC